MKTLSLLGLSFALAACGAVPEVIEPGNWDLLPPQYLSHETTEDGAISVQFDEEVFAERQDFQHNVGIAAVSTDETTCVVTLASPLPPGEESVLEGMVTDQRGNGLLFFLVVAGRNPMVPSLIINEFTPRGSSSHPDKVELRALDAGNLAGVNLLLGTPEDHTDRYVFPDLDVVAGDYIVLHCRVPDSDDPPEDELADRTASTALDTHPDAWDLFWVGGPGLSGNNGALCLSAALHGPVLDAVLYSNRRSDSDTDYDGWGSARLRDQATWLGDQGHWTVAGAAAAPRGRDRLVLLHGDAVAVPLPRRGWTPTPATDWHVVPTSTYSFGEVNSDAGVSVTGGRSANRGVHLSG
jgi:hypothetical protein